jgi:hypothetical protein
MSEKHYLVEELEDLIFRSIAGFDFDVNRPTHFLFKPTTNKEVVVEGKAKQVTASDHTRMVAEEIQDKSMIEARKKQAKKEGKEGKEDNVYNKPVALGKQEFPPEEQAFVDGFKADVKKAVGAYGSDLSEALLSTAKRESTKKITGFDEVLENFNHDLPLILKESGAVLTEIFKEEVAERNEEIKRIKLKPKEKDLLDLDLQRNIFVNYDTNKNPINVESVIYKRACELFSYFNIDDSKKGEYVALDLKENKEKKYDRRDKLNSKLAKLENVEKKDEKSEKKRDDLQKSLKNCEAEIAKLEKRKELSEEELAEVEEEFRDQVLAWDLRAYYSILHDELRELFDKVKLDAVDFDIYTLVKKKQGRLEEVKVELYEADDELKGLRNGNSGLQMQLAELKKTAGHLDTMSDRRILVGGDKDLVKDAEKDKEERGKQIEEDMASYKKQISDNDERIGVLSKKVGKDKAEIESLCVDIERLQKEDAKIEKYDEYDSDFNDKVRVWLHSHQKGYVSPYGDSLRDKVLEGRESHVFRTLKSGAVKDSFGRFGLAFAVARLEAEYAALTDPYNKDYVYYKNTLEKKRKEKFDVEIEESTARAKVKGAQNVAEKVKNEGDEFKWRANSWKEAAAILRLMGEDPDYLLKVLGKLRLVDAKFPYGGSKVLGPGGDMYFDLDQTTISSLNASSEPEFVEFLDGAFGDNGPSKYFSEHPDASLEDWKEDISTQLSGRQEKVEELELDLRTSLKEYDDAGKLFRPYQQLLETVFEYNDFPAREGIKFKEGKLGRFFGMFYVAYAQNEVNQGLLREKDEQIALYEELMLKEGIDFKALEEGQTEGDELKMLGEGPEEAYDSPTGQDYETPEEEMEEYDNDGGE